MRITILAMAVSTAALTGCDGMSLGDFEVDPAKLVEGVPGWEEAERYACGRFVDEYGIGTRAVPAKPCPAIFWYRPDPECGDTEEIDMAQFGEPSLCVRAFTGRQGVVIVRTSAMVLPSDSPITHELVHWYLGDFHHEQSELWAMAATFNAELVARGF